MFEINKNEELLSFMKVSDDAFMAIQLEDGKITNAQKESIYAGWLLGANEYAPIINMLEMVVHDSGLFTDEEIEELMSLEYEQTEEYKRQDLYSRFCHADHALTMFEYGEKHKLTKSTENVPIEVLAFCEEQIINKMQMIVRNEYKSYFEENVNRFLDSPSVGQMLGLYEKDKQVLIADLKAEIDLLEKELNVKKNPLSESIENTGNHGESLFDSLKKSSFFDEMKTAFNRAELDKIIESRKIPDKEIDVGEDIHADRSEYYELLEKTRIIASIRRLGGIIPFVLHLIEVKKQEEHKKFAFSKQDAVLNGQVITNAEIELLMRDIMKYGYVSHIHLDEKELQNVLKQLAKQAKNIKKQEGTYTQPMVKITDESHKTDNHYSIEDIEFILEIKKDLEKNRDMLVSLSKTFEW